MVGITTLQEGLELAKTRMLDLVEISGNVVPPVCKVLNFGKYKYEITKKAQEAKKKQKVVEVKEIKLRPNIAIGDFNVKLNNAKRFVSDGNKVKVSLFFKGREIAHEDVGLGVIEKFKAESAAFSKVEVDVKKEGKQLSVIIVPK
ncbi:Translation initiation factor IF-3 [Candidatus Bandiella woodruffii]|uniref:Translation initiation factor IF-3 n=2 Tax=Candidatus Bandiella euplotis TaxID=1664265 RepID=A0ABZ0UKB4_9RICK|nr:Translation initiation factor IF-3 [Candidatus Bandiella woodruffii]